MNNDTKTPATNPAPAPVAPTPAAPSTLFDYYKGKNTPLPSVADRAKLYSTTFGGKDVYTGNATQNAMLLGHLIASDKSTATTSTDKDNKATPPPTSAAVSSTGSDAKTPAAGNPAATAAPTSFQDFKNKIEPAGGEPDKPNYVDTYAKLRADQGIDTLEDNINHLQAQKDEWQSQLSTFRAADEKGATSGSVFNARMSEEERNVQERVDAIDREINLAQNTLKTKTDFISAVMSWTEKDYAAAKDQYENDLTKNIQIQNAVDTQADKIQTSARANLTTINNMISSSGKSWADVDPVLKNQVAQLELQAGFPAGTFEAFARSKPKANVVSTSVEHDAQGNEFIAVVNQDPSTGALSVTKMSTGGYTKPSGGSGTAAEITSGGFSTTKDDIGTAAAGLLQLSGKERLDKYETLYNTWIGNKGLPQDFFKNFPPDQYLDVSGRTYAIPSYIQSGLKVSQQNNYQDPSQQDQGGGFWGGIFGGQ